MARFVRCIEGHVFDAEATAQCPVCGAAVEVVPQHVEAPEPADIGRATAAKSSAVLWAIAVFGIGLGLAGGATIVWLRSDTTHPPSSAQVTQTKPDAEKTETNKPEAEKANSETKKAATADINPKVPETKLAASNAASETRVVAPPPTTVAAPVPASVAPTPTPGAPTETQSPPPTEGGPLPALSPADRPVQSADLSSPYDMQSPAHAPSSDMLPPPQANPAPPPLNSSLPPSAPLDAHSLKAAIEDTLGKLSALGPVQPDIANIATALIGHELLSHGAEDAGLDMLKQAAAANVPYAAADLGIHYFNGSRTLRRDFEQARRWLDVATLADIPIANYELAVMYIHGLGVKRDPKLSGHYFLAAYHGGYSPAVEIVANARAGHRRERDLMREIGLDPVNIGMTVLEYYNARHASDPQGARSAIEDLARGLQWPAPRILGIAQWNGTDGPADRTAAVKNFLIAARGGDFGMLIPVAEASIDGTPGIANPVQAGVLATLLQLYGENTPAQDVDRLRRISQNALDKANPEQRALLLRFKDLLSQTVPAQPQANTSDGPASPQTSVR